MGPLGNLASLTSGLCVCKSRPRMADFIPLSVNGQGAARRKERAAGDAGSAGHAGSCSLGALMLWDVSWRSAGSAFPALLSGPPPPPSTSFSLARSRVSPPPTRFSAATTENSEPSS